MKSTTQTTVKTYERINTLLETDLKKILRQEMQNEDRIILYDVGEYFVAFEKSAYLLEQWVPREEKPMLLYMKHHPFPIVMHSSKSSRVEELCRRRSPVRRSGGCLQFLTSPLENASYVEWYRQLVE